MSTTDLIYRITANSTSFSKELKSAEGDVKKFQRRAESDILKIGKAFAALGTAAAVGLAAMVKQSIDAADELAKMSVRTGVATEDLSALGFALEQSGSSLGAFENAARRLNQSIDATSNGTGNAAKRFKALGISVKDSTGGLRSNIDVFRDLADRFKDLPDGVTKSATAIDIFGRSGTELIPLLNKGSEGLDEFRVEAEKLGLVIGQDTAEAAERLNDSLNRARRIFTGFANQVMVQVLPALEDYVTATVDASAGSDNLSQSADIIGSTFRGLLRTFEGARTAFVVFGKTVGGVFGAIALEVQLGIDSLSLNLSNIGRIVAAAARGNFSEVTNLTRAAQRENQAQIELGGRRRAGAAKAAEEEILRIIEASNRRLVAINESKNKAIERSNDAASAREAADAARKANENETRRRAAALRELELANRNAAAAQQAFLDDIDSRAVRVLESLKTPLDRLNEGTNELTDLLFMGAIGVKTYSDALENLRQQYDPIAIEQARLAEQIKRDAEELERQGKSLALSLRTPIEEYTDSLGQLNMMLADGVITQETFARAVEQSTLRLDDQVKKTQDSAAAFDDFGKQAASGVFDSFTNDLFNPLEASFDKALQQFTVMIGKMALEVAKQQIIKSIFSGAASAATGGIAGFASGGYVSGPGTGTSDSIPSRLSNGEFVVKASRVRELGVGWLDSLNRGKSKPGRRNFAEGGLVTAGGGGVNLTNVNFTDPRELEEFLQSRGGEQVIMNIVRRNRSMVDA